MPDDRPPAGATDERALLGELEAVIAAEARALDEGRFEDWLALYSDDAYYWVPRRPGQTDWLNEVSIFYDDRMLMETRVRRLTEGKAHTQTPRTHTVRVLGRPMLDGGDEATGGTVVRSTFMLAEHRLDQQRIYAGTARHCLVKPGGGWRIAWKRVDLINAEGVHEPISVPV
jgi:3-phenylpropionate/cinnamic acid dioxygenase small subunit